MVNLCIIEDDTAISEALVAFFSGRPGFGNVICYNSVEGFLNAPSTLIDVVLLDIELPGITGLKGCFLIKQRYTNTSIIMLTVYDDKERVFKALQAGASGYLLKSAPLVSIEAAINEVLAGGAPMAPAIARKVISFFADMPVEKHNPKLEQLTRREIEVSHLLMEGKTYKQVSWHLKISADTVRQHIKNIYGKLEINSRVQLINEFKNS